MTVSQDTLGGRGAATREVVEPRGWDGKGRGTSHLGSRWAGVPVQALERVQATVGI